MCLQPKDASRSGWIDACHLPPSGLISAAMYLAMVPTTEGNSELVADLAAECWCLCKPQMVSICRAAATNQARLLGN